MTQQIHLIGAENRSIDLMQYLQKRNLTLNTQVTVHHKEHYNNSLINNSITIEVAEK